MRPIDVIENFDKYLYQKKLNFQAVVIGGAALSILGVIKRETQDVDVLDPEIPTEILEASKHFARQFKIPDTSLKENWLNSGPESLRRYLRVNWRTRLQPLYKGKAIIFQTLGRMDLIGTKILAYCDRGLDLNDCLDLKPTILELNELLPWVQGYDGNPNWPAYVEDQVNELKRRLGYGI